MNYTFSPYESFGKVYVAGWDDFLSEQELNEILSAPEWLNTSQAKIGTRDNGGVIQTDLRETEIAWYVRNSDNTHIWEKLAKAAMEVNRRFFRYDLTGFHEHAQLGIYKAETQGHYDWHIDSDVENMSVPRKLSMVLQLNNPSEFEGGDLEVKATRDIPKSLELKRGRAWFFPSYMLHRVTPVTRGVRRSMVLWITGPEFK